MITAWTRNLKTEEEKKDFEDYIRRCMSLLIRLEEILVEEENALGRSETDIKVFDLPNWENRQAYKNGYRACLNIMKKLVTLDQQTQG